MRATLDAIYDLFLWNDGEFEFYDEEPLPDDLLLIEVEPTTVIMEGIYRLDELARYRTLVPSDRSILWRFISRGGHRRVGGRVGSDDASIETSAAGGLENIGR